MAGLNPEIASTLQQFQMPNSLQMDTPPMQVAAMMSMAVAGAANGNVMVGGDCMGGAGASNMPPPSALAPVAPDASALALAAAQSAQLGGSATVPAPPPPFGVDQNMAQAYAQMFTSYLQQAQQAYASLGSEHCDVVAPPATASFASGPPLSSFSCSQAAPLPTAISVCVEGMKFQYQLTEDDLQKVFSRYGPVREISVDQAGTLAQITFEDYAYAQAAMNDLHGKILNGLEGTLRIEWASNAGSTTAMPPPPCPMMPPFPGGWGLPNATPWSTSPAASPLTTLGAGLDLPSPCATMMGSSPAPPGTPPPLSSAHNLMSPLTESKVAPAHVKGVRKYTCRFLIGIENDKDFQVVRRIIGAKGTNMKRIVKQSEAKLRLRGVGSGYFEGASRKESNEPLQLCVSCTSPDGYRMAVSAVEDLMEGVYQEYRIFCRENGRPEPDLHATPQLVSSGRERGVENLFSDESSLSPGFFKQPMLDNDDDDDELLGAPRREGGRRRGRRSRAKKADAIKVGPGEPPRNAPSIEEIHSMIDQRNEARRQCNFTEADTIRQSLHERGVALMDEPGGRGKASEVTTWRYWRE